MVCPLPSQKIIDADDPKLISALHRLQVARTERPQPARDERILLRDQARLCRALTLAAAADPKEPLWNQRVTSLQEIIDQHIPQVIESNQLGTLASCAWTAACRGQQNQADFLLDACLNIPRSWHHALDSDHSNQ